MLVLGVVGGSALIGVIEQAAGVPHYQQSLEGSIVWEMKLSLGNFLPNPSHFCVSVINCLS